jgi:uncharacterized protein YukE
MMMGITLKVKTEVLKSKASEVERDIKSLETQFNNIQDIVARSTGYWVGNAGDKARKEFDSQKDDTDKVIRRFKEHPVDLLTMAGVYDENEQSLNSVNKALDTDVIA